MSVSEERSEGCWVKDLLARVYGLGGTATRLDGENENYRVVSDAGAAYVLKLVARGEDMAPVDLEQGALEAVRAALPDLEVPRLVETREGAFSETYPPPGGDGLVQARLYTFIGGRSWAEVDTPSPELFTRAGRLVARIAEALAPVEQPLARRTHRWDLTQAGRHRAGLYQIEDPDRRRLAGEALRLWSGAAEPYLSALPHSLIHGDPNDDHLRVAGGRVRGLIDFGDCLYNPTVCDLAIALAYLTLDQEEPLAAGAHLVAGYHRVRPLHKVELEVLFPLVCGRLASSVVIAAGRRRLDAERAAWFSTEDRAWRALAEFMKVDPGEAASQLASRTDVAVYPERGAPRGELLRRRKARFSGALSLTYTEPLKFIRGRGQYLFDERGWPYLDLYNNVCHIGHCHPRVVEAAHRQMRLLNTNTRYLYDRLYEYADRLVETLPPGLDHCFFVNSGSEANELALRLAEAHTGRRDLVVLENAYHGHTGRLIEISPYKFMGSGGVGAPPPWVHVAPMPDGYRGRYKGQGRESGIAYGDEVGRIISDLDRPIAGFIAESLPSCGGQIIPPDGYFETAFTHVRRAGGVCILDEVQVGFGRVGTHFWGFQLQGVVPDIVVMGKPIGNGHPLGAVVTTREIAESFADAGMEFFSTFGGNPVSCAVGLAVLEVVEDEGLQEHALEVGTYLRDGLRELMDRHPTLGDVRGTGLFIGLELVEDRDSLGPATRLAAEVMNALRRRRILTGTDGPFENVIKIKPPLVVSREDADWMIEVLEEVLGSLAGL